MSTNPEDDPELPPPAEVSEPTKERFVDRTPYRIPKAPEPTPEMREEYQKRGREKKKRKHRKRRMRNAAILILLLTIPVAYVMVSSRPDRSVSEEKNDVPVEPLKDFEILLKTGSDFKLEEYSRKLESEIATGIVPQQLAALKKRLRIANELIRRNSNDDSFRVGVITKINTLSALDTFNRTTNQLADPFGSELLVFCEKYSNDSNSRIRKTAILGKFNAHLNEYLLNPSDRQFALLETKIDEFISAVPADADVARVIPMFVQIMQESENDDHITKFNRRLAEGLQDSDQPVLRDVGDTILDQIVIGTFNYDDLRSLIRISDQQAIARIESLVTAIANNPNVSAATFHNVVAIVETFSRINQDELEKRLIEELRTCTEKIKNKDKQEKIVKLFESYDIREKLIGRKFELGSGILEDPALPVTAPTVIMFFTPLHQKSVEWIAFLVNMDELEPLKNRYIIVCTDAELDQELRKQIKRDFPNGILVGPEEKEFYLQQCPISHVPTIVVLDPEQRIVAVNVSIDDVRKHLSDLANVVD